MTDRAWWTSLLATVDARDVPGFLSFLTDDAEFRFGNGPSVEGREAVGALVEGFLGAIGGTEHVLTRHWDGEDSAVGEGLVTYTRLDGTTLTLPFVNVFDLRDGKVSRYCIYIDNRDLF
jgi:ketosteroid isomerase-like protein